MRFGTALISIVGLMLFSACGGPPPSVGERSLDLGTGTWRFDALEDGQEVDMVRGAQGGWHVWVSLQTEGLEDVDAGLMTLTLQPADESREPQVTEVNINFDPPTSDGRRNFLGWPGIIDDPSCQLGELLRVEARLDVGDNAEPLVAERMILPLGGVYPPPACE